MELIVQYFEGCPHSGVAVDRLREAVRQAGLGDPEISMQRIDTPEQAAAVGFHGSPTILIDGEDPFAEASTPVGFACRVYTTPSGREGAPTAAQLAQALLGRGHAA